MTILSDAKYRAVTRAHVSVLLKLTLMTTDFKRNLSGRTRIYEYSPPPPN